MYDCIFHSVQLGAVKILMRNIALILQTFLLTNKGYIINKSKIFVIKEKVINL